MSARMLILMVMLVCASAYADPPPLIARDVLFGNPDERVRGCRPTASGSRGSRPTRTTCSRSG